MKNTDKQKVATKLIQAAQKYDEYLNNLHFLIVYQKDNQHQLVQIGFRDLHFKHLTGVESRLSAQRFYAKCINNKLSINDFEISKDGKSEQKLIVLPYLHELLYHNCMIGVFINSGIRIQADYFVGDTKAVLSVGFRQGIRVDIPVTLYKENVKKLSKPVYKVLAIFKKRYNQIEYKECTYLSKGQIINSLKIPENIKISEKLKMCKSE